VKDLTVSTATLIRNLWSLKTFRPLQYLWSLKTFRPSHPKVFLQIRFKAEKKPSLNTPVDVKDLQASTAFPEWPLCPLWALWSDLTPFVFRSRASGGASYYRAPLGVSGRGLLWKKRIRMTGDFPH
jgi:hypothetical protein